MADDRLAAKLAHHANQAQWTREIRQHVYRQIELRKMNRALEVGCGGGLITVELNETTREGAVGCDVDPAMVAAAQKNYPQLSFTQNQPTKLPFADGEFAFVCCHFMLLWAQDPIALLKEMKRVTAKGGAVAALAEPDWGGYLEWPDQGLRELIAVALATEGADPHAGRKLFDWFAQAGMQAQVGISAGPWLADAAGLDAAWAHHRLTLAGVVDERKLRVLEAKDRRAWREGKRLSHLPLAWAITRV